MPIINEGDQTQWTQSTHLVNLVATVLLQIALDVAQEGDVADTSGDQEK